MINYKLARSEFINISEDLDSIEMIYEAGSVSVPGLSDLDFIIIINDRWDCQQTQLFYSKIENFSKNLKCAIGPGNVLIIPSSLHFNMLLIDDFKLKLLFSRSCMTKTTNYEDKFIKICRILDWLPERINTLATFLENIRDFHNLYNYEFQLHGLLKSTMVSILKTEEFLDNKDFSLCAKACKNNLDFLRINWFKLNKRTKHNQMVNIAIEILRVAMKGLDIISAEVSESLDGTISLSETNSQNVEFKPFQIPKKKKWYLLNKFYFEYEYPNLVFINYYLQCNLNNPISSFLTKSITYSDKVKINGDNFFLQSLSRTIDRRIDFVSKNYIFLKDRRFHSGLLKYGMCLKNGL